MTANTAGVGPYARSNGVSPAGATNYSQGRAPAAAGARTGAVNTADVRNSLYNKRSAANPYQVGRTSAYGSNPRSTYQSQPATSPQHNNSYSTPSPARANTSANPYRSPTGYPTTSSHSAYTPPTTGAYKSSPAAHSNQTPYTSRAPSATTPAPSNSGAATSNAGAAAGATSWPANGTAAYRPGSTNANLSTGVGTSPSTTPGAGSPMTGQGSVYR